MGQSITLNTHLKSHSLTSTGESKSSIGPDNPKAMVIVKTTTMIENIKFNFSI